MTACLPLTYVYNFTNTLFIMNNAHSFRNKKPITAMYRTPPVHHPLCITLVWCLVNGWLVGFMVI